MRAVADSAWQAEGSAHAIGGAGLSAGDRATVLVIAEAPDVARQLRRNLENDGYQVCIRAQARQGLAEWSELDPDAVVVDTASLGADAARVMRRIGAFAPGTPVIALADADSAAGAADAIRAGAMLAARPPAPGMLRLLLEKAFNEQRRADALEYYRQRDARRAGVRHLIGESTPMLRLRTRIQLLLDAESQPDAAAPAPVLVCGEPGTGKERVARALHFDGPRRLRAFVKFDPAGVAATEPQIDAHLFGHPQDAIAGASRRAFGLAEAADGGTLFIYEIADLPWSDQRRVLDLLDRHVVRRTGSTHTIPIDVRVVAATRHPLQALRSTGRLLPALHDRLAADRLEVPPLRERRSDIALLARHFVEKHAEQQRRAAPALSAEALRALTQHDWPGNVRELRAVLERAMWLGPGRAIEAHYLASSTSRPAAAAESKGQANLAQIERDALLHALARARWNVSQAARLLGVTRDTLRYRMDRHALSRATFIAND